MIHELITELTAEEMCMILSQRIVRELEGNSRYEGFVNAFSDPTTLYEWSEALVISIEDMHKITDYISDMIIKDLRTRKSKMFSQRMRARLAMERCHYELKKSHVFFNFVKEKKRFSLHKFLKTHSVSTPKGLMHLLRGGNFMVCTVSHFFDRVIERHGLDRNRPRCMDYLYTKLFGGPIIIGKWNDDNIIKLNEGAALGKVIHTDNTAIFFLMTFIADDLITEEQNRSLDDGDIFITKLLQINFDKGNLRGKNSYC